MPRAPIYVRMLSEDEQVALRTGLRSRDAFVLRRCQIVLASAGGKRASQIAEELGCDTDTALNSINAFNCKGLEALTPGSSVSQPNVARRKALADAALAENARLVATHIPGVDRLERTATGARWTRT